VKSQAVIPLGLNTDAPPVYLRAGEMDVATDVDPFTIPGGMQRRYGSSRFQDKDSVDCSTTTKIANSAVMTLSSGTSYLFVKLASAGAASLRYVQLAPTLGSWTTVDSPSGVTPAYTAAPGTFMCHNGCMYYFNPGGNVWWNGSASYNCGLAAPTGKCTATAKDNKGHLKGWYLWAISVYDSSRNVESNIAISFPITDYNTQGLHMHPAAGVAKTLATIARGTALKAAGDLCTDICLWRSLGNVQFYSDGTRNLTQLVPMYRVLSSNWDGTASPGISVVDGQSDGSLDKAEVAPIQDNHRPPTYAFAAMQRNRLTCLSVGGQLRWSQANRPEQFPIQNSWSVPWGVLFRGLTRGRENRLVGAGLDGPAIAMAPVGDSLLAFTRTGTWAVLGGEAKWLQRLPTPHGCVAAKAVATLPGGGALAVSPMGVVQWPSGKDILKGRLSEVVKTANQTYLDLAVAGYDAFDDAAMVAVPQGAQTKASTVYLFDTAGNPRAKWNFAWATTHGITGIQSVVLPGARPYVLFMTDSGRIYKYPDSASASSYLDGAADAFYGGSFRMSLSDGTPRDKDVVATRAFLGTIGGTVRYTITSLPKDQPLDRSDDGYSTWETTDSDTIDEMRDQNVRNDGAYQRLTVTTPDESEYGWAVKGLWMGVEELPI